MSDRLRQLELVGRGGMAEVYRGALLGERGTSLPVAIKRLRPELAGDAAAVELFVNEARLAVGLTHPNLVHALELARDDRGYALVCEWLEGASLAAVHARAGALPRPLVLYVGRALATALAHLHNLETGAVVHRDVSPANVFVTVTGQVKLGDLGVASCAAHRPLVCVASAGTAGFVAPEVEAGADADARADVFGAAATLRAMSGELPPELDSLLRHAMAPDPAARLGSAGELEQALAVVAMAKNESAGPEELSRWLCEHDALPRRAPPPSLDRAVTGLLAPVLSTAPSSAAPGRRDATRAASRPRRRLRPGVAAGLVLLAAGVAGLGLWLPDERETSCGTAQGEAGLAGAADVQPAAVPGAETPAPSATPWPPTAQERRPASGAAGAAVQDRPAVGAAAAGDARPSPPAAQVPPQRFGTLSLNATPWAQVSIDGSGVGNTPLRAVRLSAGAHVVTLVHPPQGLRHELTVRVDPDERQTLVVDLRRGSVERRLER